MVLPSRWRWALMIMAIGGIVHLAYQVTFAISSPGATDFVSFLAAAKAIEHGGSCFYCVTTQLREQVAIIHFVPPPSAHYPILFYYPAVIAVVLVPLTLISLRPALDIFLATLVAAIFISNRLLRPYLRGVKGCSLLAFVALANLPGAVGISLGQWDALLTIPAALAIREAERGRHFRSGLLLSVLLLKPQTVWLAPVIALWIGRSFLAGLVVGGAVWVATSAAVVGFGQMRPWVTMVVQHRNRLAADSTAGIPPLAHVIGDGAVLACVITLTVLCAGAAAWWRQGVRSQPHIAIGLGLAVSLMAAPHLHLYDLILMAVPTVMYAQRFPRAAIAVTAAAGAGYVVDRYVVGGDALYTGAHLSTLAYVPLVLSLFAILRYEHFTHRPQAAVELIGTSRVRAGTPPA